MTIPMRRDLSCAYTSYVPQIDELCIVEEQGAKALEECTSGDENGCWQERLGKWRGGL